MTPERHSVSYIEIQDISALKEIPKDFDFVAISSYSAQIREAYQLAGKYRQENIPVLIGGPHATALPDEAAEFCDAVVIGEGEASWENVLSDCETHKLSGFYGSKNSDFDFSNAPMPAYHLLDISKYNRLTVQTSRGCPHRCEFCAGSVMLTDRYKQKPIAKVIAEIDSILKLWKHPFIEFADDNSFVNKSYWKELLKHLKNKHLRWFTESDISIGEDDELLDLMRESGCAQVLIGLESPVGMGLDGIELKSNWKFGKLQAYKDAIKNIQSHGITVNGCFVIGLDGHSEDIFDEVFEFVKDSELYEVQITIPTAFPGTPFYERLKKEGRIIEDHRWEKCTLFDVNFIPTDMSSERLSQGFRKLAVRIYSEEFTKWRRNNFKKNLRALFKN